MGKIVRPNSRTQPSGERRQALLNAAEKLFFKQGIAPTSVEQISAGASLAKGSFYLHFSSKEALIAALGDRFARALLEEVRGALERCAEKDWKGRLAAWARACVNGYLDSIRLHDLLFYGWRNPTREGLVDNNLIDHLTAFLRVGAAAKAWQIDDARQAAVFIFSGLTSVADDAHLREKKVERARLGRRVERLVLSAVGKG